MFCYLPSQVLRQVLPAPDPMQVPEEGDNHHDEVLSLTDLDPITSAKEVEHFYNESDEDDESGGGGAREWEARTCNAHNSKFFLNRRF